MTKSEAIAKFQDYIEKNKSVLADSMKLKSQFLKLEKWQKSSASVNLELDIQNQIRKAQKYIVRIKAMSDDDFSSLDMTDILNTFENTYQTLKRTYENFYKHRFE